MKEQVIEEEEGNQESPIHGDLLEEVFSHVPLIDLAYASRVSKNWENAIISSLSHVNKLKPWLIIQTQNTSFLPNKIKTHAYDPRSDSWVEIIHLSKKNSISQIQSSNSSLFYQISCEGLSFSVDPLHIVWHQIPPPNTWRVDPIVAVVGPHVIVAGGGSGLLDDPLTVEMYDMEANHWSTCQSMPSILKNSAASTWVSVASNQHKMYVIEKASNITYIFSPKTRTWSGPYNLRPDQSLYFSASAFFGEDLILAGLLGNAENVTSLKIWKINLEMMECDEIGEIPNELLEKLKGEEDCYVLSSITLLATKDFIYMYKSSEQSVIVFCEFVGGECKWGSVKNIVLNDESKIGEKMVMSCGNVGIANLQMAMNSRNVKFVPKVNV